MILGHVGLVERVDPMSISPVIDSAPYGVLAASRPSQAYHLIIAPGNIAPGAYVERSVNLPDAPAGTTATVTSAPPDANAALTASVPAAGVGLIRVTNTGSDVLWLSRDVAVDVQLSR